MQPADFAQQELPLTYKTKTIKRLDPTTYVFHCTARNDAGGRVNRNMVVISSSENDGGELSLIDPLRITSEGERKLQKLGTVARVIRLGANLHAAEEDSYYLTNYPKCERWAPGEFLHSLDLPIDKKLTENGPTPFPFCKIFLFKDAAQPEAAVLLYREGRHGNLLVTGESLQHQLDNEFINMPVVAKMKLAGLLESDIVVSQQWLKVMMPPTSVNKPPPNHYKDAHTNRPRMRRMSSLSGKQKALRGDFMRLLGLDFQRLLSTSGNVVKYGAKKGAVLAVEYAFPLWERSSRGI
jgi:hypothetical protein